MEPLNRVCRSQRLPLRFRKGKDCEQLVAAFAKARHHAWAALGPRALEGRVGGTGRVGAGSVDDTMEVVADRGQCVLRRFPLEVAELVYTAALHHRPRPHLADGAPQPGITVDDRQHRRPQSSRDEIVETALPR